MEPICFADCRSRLNTVSPCMNRIFLNWIQSWASGTCTVCLSCRVFVHKRICLKCKLPLFASVCTLSLCGPHSSESVLSAAMAGWTALLFRWMRPCFFFLGNQTDTDSSCESLKNVENQGLSEVASKVLHVNVYVCFHFLCMWVYVLK